MPTIGVAYQGQFYGDGLIDRRVGYLSTGRRVVSTDNSFRYTDDGVNFTTFTNGSRTNQYNASFRVDSQDRLHVIYFDSVNYYVNYSIGIVNGGSIQWITTFRIASSGGTYGPSKGDIEIVEISPTNIKVHVGYTKQTSSSQRTCYYGRLNVTFNSETSASVTWEVQDHSIGSYGSGLVGGNPRLKRDAAGNIYFFSNIYGNYNLYFIKRNGNTWDAPTVISGYPGSNARHAFDVSPDGTIHALSFTTSYSGGTSNFEIKYHRRDPSTGAWQEEIVVQGSNPGQHNGAGVYGNEMNIAVWGNFIMAVWASLYPKPNIDPYNNENGGLWGAFRMSSGNWSVVALDSRENGRATTIARRPDVQTSPDNSYVSIVYEATDEQKQYPTFQIRLMTLPLSEFNQPPDPPTPVKISSEGYTINRRPKFFFRVSDPDGDQITDMRIQISSKQDFSSLYVDDRYSTSVYTTFTGLPANSGGTVEVQVTGGNPLVAGHTYYIRARVKDAKGSWSEWSLSQAFTVASVPWSDTIPADATAFKAEWMNQISEAINAARLFRGLPTVSFTDGTIVAGQTDIKAVHVTERQKALQEVLTTIGVWKEICPDGGAELGTAWYKGGAYRTNADKYVGSYCHALLTNVDWNGLYLVPSSGYTLYPGIVYRVAAMVKNPTPQSGYINLFTTELWTNSGLEAKIIPAGMDWTLYEWFFTVEEITTVSHLRIEESGFNGYSGEIYLDLLTLRPAWTHELNLLATTVLGADSDWSKWQHYNNTYYWDSSSQYNHELYGRVFRGQAVTSESTVFLYLYGNYPFIDYPFAVKAGQPHLFGLWVKLSPGQTAATTARVYFRKPDGSNLVQKYRHVTLTQDWQYLEFILTPTRSMNVGVGWSFTDIQGLTLHAAMPVVRPLVDRSGIHIQELRDYLLHT